MAAPGVVPRSAATADSQKCCGSCSRPSTATQATRSPRPLWLIQDRTSTVLPLPAGAHTWVTRGAVSS